MTEAFGSVATVAWWRDDAAIHRFIADLVASELLAMRKSADFATGCWTRDTHLDKDLGVDSLELMSLASALAQALHMHESGIEDYLLVRRTLGDWCAIAQASLERFSARMTFRTSGSTGQPKSCTHSLHALWQEVQEVAPLLSGCARLFAAVPSHHIYGFLFTILLPRALGLESGSVQDLRHGSPARLSRDLREGDVIVGHPEFWRMVLRVLPRLPSAVTGVTSTAPLPAEIDEGLSTAGLGNMLQIYGSSESAGVGWRTRNDQPYVLFSFWKRATPGGNALLREGENDGVDAPDLLAWQDDRHFYPAGRVDSAVQVGGVNVFPQRVQGELLLHPEVAEAAVRLMRPDEGNRLKAFIVPRDPGADTSRLAQNLAAWTRQRLGAAEQPRSFSFGASLPVDQKGKQADWLTATPLVFTTMRHDEINS
jgi:4-coumarate--CoA ligase (photoactive yellow protein activation family)